MSCFGVRGNWSGAEDIDWAQYWAAIGSGPGYLFPATAVRLLVFTTLT